MNSYLSMPDCLKIRLTEQEEHLAETICIASSIARDKDGNILPPLLQVQAMPAFTISLLKVLDREGYELTRNGVKL